MPLLIKSSQQVETTDSYLVHVNKIWDRLQLTVFFTQETLLSILYIFHTGKHLRNWSQFLIKTSTSSSSTGSATSEKMVLYHLIYMNLLVIALDITLLGIEYADLFYLQGAFKPCVYGIKLKVEFLVLNRLIERVRARGSGSGEPTIEGDGSPSILLQRSSGGGRNVGERQQRVELQHIESGAKELHRSRSRESQAPILKKGQR